MKMPGMAMMVINRLAYPTINDVKSPEVSIIGAFALK